MNIFHKTTQEEYNNKLEQILENKVFDTESKNLLLSMVYKIENAYDDYYKVKPLANSKEVFISKILYIIENECDMIEIITPGTKKARELKNLNKKFNIDISQGKVSICGNEKDMLSALIELDEEYNYYKYREVQEVIEVHSFIKKGEAMSESEVIRDFNGWSWNTIVKEIEDLQTNLAYQNVLILLDEKIKLEENDITTVNSKDINSDTIVDSNIIEEQLELKYEKKDISDFLKYLKIIIERNNYQEYYDKKIEVEEKYNYNKKMMELMEDKIELLEVVTREKKELAKKIKEIDKTLNNPEILEKEYLLRNKKLEKQNKIFSISHLNSMLEQERVDAVNKIRKLNDILDPKKYLKEKEKIQIEFENSKKIMQSFSKNNIDLINLQKEFLKCFNIKIEKAQKKDELRKLLVQFRYFCVLPFNEIQQIKDVPELQEKLQEVMNNLIDKSIDKNLIINISNSISLCYNIMKYVFFSRIIDLEKINIKIKKLKNTQKTKEKNDTIEISLFDNNEEEERYRETINNLKQINIKLNRRIPLFL